jgi:hypothetical protein
MVAATPTQHASDKKHYSVEISHYLNMLADDTSAGTCCRKALTFQAADPSIGFFVLMSGFEGVRF